MQIYKLYIIKGNTLFSCPIFVILFIIIVLGNLCFYLLPIKKRGFFPCRSRHEWFLIGPYARIFIRAQGPGDGTDVLTYIWPPATVDDSHCSDLSYARRLSLIQFKRQRFQRNDCVRFTRITIQHGQLLRVLLQGIVVVRGSHSRSGTSSAFIGYKCARKYYILKNRWTVVTRLANDGHFCLSSKRVLIVCRSKIISPSPLFCHAAKLLRGHFWHVTLSCHVQETIRRRQAEAAEKRIAEQQQRGIKDIESVKRQQRRALELEKREQEAAASGTQPTLRVRTWTIAFYFNYIFGFDRAWRIRFSGRYNKLKREQHAAARRAWVFSHSDSIRYFTSTFTWLTKNTRQT